MTFPHPMTKVAPIAALICIGTACAQGPNMNSADVSGKLVEAAVAAGWNPGDVEILGNPDLDRSGCRFFNAVHKRKMDGATLELAVLPDGKVVGGDPGRADDHAAASILAHCGAEAPPDWWAEIIARFSKEAHGRVVKSEKNAFDVDAIEKRGGTFSPPAMERDGASTQVRFYTMRYEPTQPCKVSARLSDKGELAVTSELLGDK